MADAECDPGLGVLEQRPGLELLEPGPAANTILTSPASAASRIAGNSTSRYSSRVTWPVARKPIVPAGIPSSGSIIPEKSIAAGGIKLGSRG
jgi:hypothetical protein